MSAARPLTEEQAEMAEEISWDLLHASLDVKEVELATLEAQVDRLKAALGAQMALHAWTLRALGSNWRRHLRWDQIAEYDRKAAEAEALRRQAMADPDDA